MNSMATVYKAERIANEVARETNASSAGVAVTVSVDREQQLTYNIWKAVRNDFLKHNLLASETSKERLKAHVEGFIENVKDKS